MRPRAFVPVLLLVLALSAGLVGSWAVPIATADPVDTDSDGIADAQDACLHEPGPSGNGGCPVVTAPYFGDVGTKLNVSNPIKLPATIEVLVNGSSVVADGSSAAAQGAIRFDTSNTSAWKPPVKTAANTWTWTSKGSSSTAAGVFINSQWRALQVGAKLTIKLSADGGSLYMKLTGMAPNGVGTNRVGVEAESVGTGLRGPLEVVSFTPAQDSTVGTSPSITVTLNGPLAGFNAALATIDCGTGPAAFASATIAGHTVTLTPATPLTEGATCIVRIMADAPSDADANDPPDGLLADYFFSLRTDVPPSVLFTLPGDSEVVFGPSFPLSVAFSEPVTLDAGAILVSGCGLSHTSAARPTPLQYYNVELDGAIPGTCTITVVAAKVHDVDAADAPDMMAANFTSTFRIDGPPVVTIVSPADGAVLSSEGSATMIVTFSEPVYIDDGAFSFSGCVSPALSTLGSSIPASAVPVLVSKQMLTAGLPCTFTAHRLAIRDADGVGEEHPVSDVSIQFSIDVAPTIVSTELIDDNSDTSDTMDPTGHIRVTYSEPIAIGTFGAWGMTCDAVQVPMTLTIDPNDNTAVIFKPTDSSVAALHGGPSCVASIGADAIVDADSADPPNAAPAHNIPFDVNEVAPFITNIRQVENAFDPQNPFWVLVVDFSEPVEWDLGGMHASCLDGGFEILFGGPSMDGRTFTYSQQYEEPCDFTITASIVHDLDTNDGPDDLVAGAMFEFPGVVWP